MTYTDFKHVVLEFLSNGEGLNCLLQYVSPKHSKITVTFPKSVKRTKLGRVNFDLPKISKININFELLKDNKMTSLKIYISTATEKLEIANLVTR